MRHPVHTPRFEALHPISTQAVLFPGASSCQMPTLSKFPPAMPPSDERSQAMKKWAEGRAHIQHLVDSPKEDCMLVFQCLMIMWCYINSYPSRLLKRFTVYDFVNFNENGSGSYVVAVEDGTKYKYRTALRFNKFEKSVLTFFFKHIRPLWINALRVLNESFDVTTLVADFKERTQSFFYNSQGKNQLNNSRVCENFQSKMNATHKKKRKAIVAGPDEDRINDDAENHRPSTIDDPTVNLKKARISQNELMTMSLTSKKRVFFSDSDFVENFNGVSCCVFTTRDNGNLSNVFDLLVKKILI